jgi:succinyl-CoA synthetase beta subunit/citryl-CoA synthetase large subunit
MRFYEFEAKRLLEKHGIPVCRSGTAETGTEAERLASEIGCPVALKSQVLSGGRMKAGGVKFAENPEQARREAEEILGLAISGRRPERVLVEKKADVSREYGVSVTYDAVRKLAVMTASDMGGEDMEEVAETHPDHVKSRRFSTIVPLSDYRAKELVAALGLTGSDLTRMTAVVSRLAQIFFQYDLTLAEINSLASLEDGRFVALDCHLDMEEEGRFRQGAILEEFGIQAEDTRRVREPTSFEIEAAKIDAEDPRGIVGPVVEFDMAGGRRTTLRSAGTRA